MRRLQIVSMLLVLGMLSCQSPPAEPQAEGTTDTPPPAQPVQLDQPVPQDPPAGNQVDLYLRGLFALIPKGQGVQAVFLSPGGEAHPPVLAVLSWQVAESNNSKPDVVTTASAGDGLALWRFKAIGLNGNVKQDPLVMDDTPLHKTNGKLDETDYSKLRWVPHMDEIFGTLQQVDTNEVGKAAATMTLALGDLDAWFDLEGHKQQGWTIGQRNAPVADGVRLRVTLEDAGLPLSLGITRESGDETIEINGGSTVLVSGYPTTIPKKGDDMKHFHHYYKLVQIGSGTVDDKLPNRSAGPTYNPVRCAPVKFP